MTEINQNPMPEHGLLFPTIDRVSAFISKLYHKTDFTRLPLAKRGDHEFVHPLDAPLVPSVEVEANVQGQFTFSEYEAPGSYYFADKTLR